MTMRILRWVKVVFNRIKKSSRLQAVMTDGSNSRFKESTWGGVLTDLFSFDSVKILTLIIEIWL